MKLNREDIKKINELRKTVRAQRNVKINSNEDVIITDEEMEESCELSSEL